MQNDFRSPVVLLGLALFLAGCSRPAGLTYQATALYRNDGKVVEGSIVSARGVPARSASEVEVKGKKGTIQVKGIERDQARFEITYPDGKSELVELRAGESKEFFSNSKDFGVRMRLTAINP
jgi:hypothetical protein